MCRWGGGGNLLYKFTVPFERALYALHYYIVVIIKTTYYYYYRHRRRRSRCAATVRAKRRPRCEWSHLIHCPRCHING